MRIDVPLGEVVDRITILRIKVARLADAEKVANVRHHLALLEEAWSREDLPPLSSLQVLRDLHEVNGQLWDVEDALRAHEAQGRFDEAFVELARSVYRLNDRRAALKRAVDEALGSALVEEKSYRGSQARQVP